MPLIETPPVAAILPFDNNYCYKRLGHTDIASTARYAHLARDAERISAARVSDSIEANILPRGVPTRADGIDADIVKAAPPVAVRSPRDNVRDDPRAHGTGELTGRYDGKVWTMAKPIRRPLSNRAVDALEVGRDRVIWDTGLSGFGVRVYSSGRKVYIAQGRGPQGTRRVTLGRHRAVSAGEARRRAEAALARIRAGEEPNLPAAARNASGPAVAELAERYFREHVAVRCKPGTVSLYRHVVDKHVLPALGHVPIAALGREQVAELHYRLRKKPVTANQAVGALSRMFNRAEAWGMVQPGTNPCRFVKPYRERRRERFLTEDEFRRLGRTLERMETEGDLPGSVAGAIRLLMLTGCRSGEILHLRWDDVRLEESEIRLRDSKTGPRAVSLSPGAARALAGIPRVPGIPWVVPGRWPDAPLRHLTHHWYKVRKQAGLDDVRIHDLRHSFASRALALGEDLTMIGKLLGHSKIQTTARYAHLAREGIAEAAGRVAASIAANLD